MGTANVPGLPAASPLLRTPQENGPLTDNGSTPSDQRRRRRRRKALRSAETGGKTPEQSASDSARGQRSAAQFLLSSLMAEQASLLRPSATQAYLNYMHANRRVKLPEPPGKF